MKYDESLSPVYFSENPKTNFAEKMDVMGHMVNLTSDMVQNYFAEQRKDEPKKPAKANIAGIVLILLLFAALIITLMAGAYTVAAIIGGVFLTGFGISTFFDKNSSGRRGISPLESRTGRSFVFVALGLVLIVLVLVAPVLETMQCVFVGCGCLAFAFTLMCIMDAVVGSSRARKNYTVIVPAKCIGYLKRTRAFEATGGVNGVHKTYVEGTPVFQFEYSGIMHKAFLNEFSRGKLQPAYGKDVEISINPEDHDDILYRPYLKKRNVKLVLLAVVTLIVAIAFLAAAALI